MLQIEPLGIVLEGPPIHGLGIGPGLANEAIHDVVEGRAAERVGLPGPKAPLGYEALLPRDKGPEVLRGEGGKVREKDNLDAPCRLARDPDVLCVVLLRLGRG